MNSIVYLALTLIIADTAIGDPKSLFDSQNKQISDYNSEIKTLEDDQEVIIPELGIVRLIKILNVGDLGKNSFISIVDLGDGWEDQDVHNDTPETRKKALQMGANLVQFALMNN